MVGPIRDYQHIITDTENNPTNDDFKDMTTNCDLLVIPAVPESVATDGGLTHTLALLRTLGKKTHRVPPKPCGEGLELHDKLTGESVPVSSAEIPRFSAFEKAAAKGMQASAVKDPRKANRAWEAYVAAGREVARG
jgi:chromosome partitioning protein